MNFFSYMFGKNEAVAMDGGMGYDPQHPKPGKYGLSHEDGSPCDAKKPENCPHNKKARLVEEKKQDADTLVKGEAAKLEKTANEEAMEKIEKGENPELDGIIPVAMSDLPTFKETESKYRKLRNEAYRVIMDNNLGDGTYPLDDPSKKVQHKTGGEISDGFARGWQVSFQTTNGEGFNEGNGTTRLTDADYDRITEEMMKETGSKPYVGVFGGIPEISFVAKTKDQALRLAKKYNQVSIANNRRIAADKWDELTFPANPDYNWKENQIFKAK